MAGFEVEAKTELEPWARDALDQQDAARPAQGAKAAATHDPAPSHAAAQPKSEVDSLMVRMEILEPGDFKLVASIIENHPDLRDVIITKAQQVCGNATVAKALDLLAKPKPAAGGDKATTASPAAEHSAPDKAGEAVVTAKHGAAQKPEEFEYIVSPLALEPTSVKEHVDFILKNPQLRDKVISGAAEFDPKLASEVEAALRGNAPPAQEQVAPTPTPVDGQGKSEPAPAPKSAEKFEYIVSPLALEYDRESKIQDHVDFILKNPQLRDQVLIGAAEFDAPLAEEVRQRLMNPKPAPAVTETEPTPPDAIAKDAEQAAPAPKKHKHKHASESAPAKKDKAEAGWVVRARAYNAAHSATVDAFLQITGGACLDAAGNVDPHLVANWQAAHGSPPDGRIGEGTVAAAILDSPLDDGAMVAKTAPAAPSDGPPRAT